MDNKRASKSKYSWWEKRTRIEKYLLVSVVFALLVIIFLASNLMMTKLPSSESLNQKVCMSEKCIQSAANILEKIDRKVDPCDDFYRFACGNFIKKTIIPDHKTTVSAMSEANDNIDLKLMNVFDEPIQDGDANSLKLVKTIYKSCMNTTRIEKEGLQFFKKNFKELGGWPVIESSYWNEKMFDWKTLLYKMKSRGWRHTFFIGMHVGADIKNSSRRILQITQPCFPYDRLKKGLNDTAVKASYDYLINLATLFGADKLHAAVEMKEVIDFEINIAKIILPWEKRKNASLNYNPMTIRALQRNFSSIPWLQLINNYLSPIDMYTSDDVVSIAVPQYLEDLEDLLIKTKKRVLANYMFSRIVRDSVKHLPEEFRRKELEYAKIVYGKNQVTPRWKECVYEADMLHVAVSALYVKRFFDKSIKHKVTELVLDIKSSFMETLKKTGWMDRKTKKAALLKAEKMHSFIAYPEQLLDDDKVEEYYEGLELAPDQYYLKTRLNLSLFFHMKYIKQLREPVMKPDWRSQTYSYFINAFYNQIDNSIDLPAAILAENFFDPNNPQYINYGRIGEVIGHEITHGFDDSGRQYDKDGNVVDWWEPETNKTFTKKSQCLVEQYGNYTVPEIDMNLNGEKTLGENIADNGGIKIAYRGYLKWLERNSPEPGLPGLNKYTPRQLFWITSAQSWCIKYKKEVLKQKVISGQHSPNYFRIVVPFMNSDYFGRDFNCPLGSPMNPKYKCRVW